VLAVLAPNNLYHVGGGDRANIVDPIRNGFFKLCGIFQYLTAVLKNILKLGLLVAFKGVNGDFRYRASLDIFSHKISSIQYRAKRCGSRPAPI
jgi:hypothetical protein